MTACGTDGASRDVSRTRDDTLRRLALAFVALLTLARTADTFLVPLLRDDVLEGDLNQHVWWTARFTDPALFPNDITAEFFAHPLVSPVGHQLIYRALVPYADPQHIAESIPFVLGAAVVVLAFLLGRWATDSFVGGMIGALFVLCWEPVFQLLASGLQRAFALPVIMLGMWALAVRRHELVASALIIGAMIYPTAFFNVAALAVVVIGRRWWSERRAPEDWVTLLVATTASALIILGAYVYPWPVGFGPQVTAAAARVMPEFSIAGRIMFFSDNPIMFYVMGPQSGIGYPPGPLAAVAAMVLASTLIFRRLLRFEAWALLGTSLALFVAAHLTLFTLYFPNRYVKYSLPVFMLLWLTAFAIRLGKAVDRWDFGATVSAMLRRHPMVAALTGLVALCAYGAVVARDVAAEVRRSPKHPGREEVYQFLATLPKHTLIAAHPSDANAIPLRTRRSVLASKETALPYLLGYYGVVTERLEAELAAYYASTFTAVDELRRQYGVDVMLVSRERFGDSGTSLYEPLIGVEQMFREIGRESEFVLLHPPADRILFSNDDYWVVRLK